MKKIELMNMEEVKEYMNENKLLFFHERQDAYKMKYARIIAQCKGRIEELQQQEKQKKMKKKNVYQMYMA